MEALFFSSWVNLTHNTPFHPLPWGRSLRPLQPESALKRRRPAFGPCCDGRLKLGRLHYDVLPLRRQPRAQLREGLAQAVDPVVARRFGLAEPRHIVCDSVLVRRETHARIMEKRDP